MLELRGNKLGRYNTRYAIYESKERYIIGIGICCSKNEPLGENATATGSLDPVGSA